ncbi:MAG: hypothetical protein BGO95_10525 [Micrococcales bacterium 73-13]|nr:MAG: hypothetical protein BGO95_10525 [Micrococcales bacterium 73-13]
MVNQPSLRMRDLLALLTLVAAVLMGVIHGSLGDRTDVLTHPASTIAAEVPAPESEASPAVVPADSSATLGDIATSAALLGCVFLALCSLLIAPRAVRLWRSLSHSVMPLSDRSVPVANSLPLARPEPAPSLLLLSISRT